MQPYGKNIHALAAPRFGSAFALVGARCPNFSGRRKTMCDYSLHGIENRLAVEGEVLVVHRFHTGSKGLTSPSYLEPAKQSKSFMAFLATKFVEPSNVCAVCIPDGARLAMTGISPAFQSCYGLSAT